MRPSRRLGYRFHVAFDADPETLNLALDNHGQLGVHLQARSKTVAGAPYSYTIGAGDQIAVALANPGPYDLSLHGPNGSFRHCAGSPATLLQVRVDDHHYPSGRLTLHLTLDGDAVGIPRADGPERRQLQLPACGSRGVPLPADQRPAAQPLVARGGGS